MADFAQPQPMLFAMTLLFVVIFYVLGASIARFSAGISTYSSVLNERLASIQALVDSLGLANVKLRDVVEPRALTGAVGVVLSGIAGFLSNLFLILMIVLFLLAEGPAIMDRLRASAGEDHPQVERLAFVGQGVVRQFGLRAILNLVTAVGFTVLLLALGVDFALMWGILTFFLSFVPYVGLVLAAPPVLLALAEFGVGRALLVIAGVTVVNILAENVLSPMMSRGLSISPTVVFLSFVFWAWLHNAPLRRIGERVVINTGTWLKKLERVPARFLLLPSVYHPSFRLNYFRISEDDGRIAIDYERIQKAPPRELSLLQRMVAKRPQRDALEDIPERAFIG